MSTVFVIEGFAKSDYYDGALFGIENGASMQMPALHSPELRKMKLQHHDWEDWLADAMYLADADGQRVRVTAEVIEPTWTPGMNEEVVN